jgi:hypothetical protein
MAELKQQVYIKFCFKLWKNVTENFEMLKTASEEMKRERTQVFHWFSKFKIGVTSTKSGSDEETC